MKILKSYTGAMAVLAAVIVLSIPLGCIRSVNAERAEVLTLFQEGMYGDGHSVSSDMQQRIDIGKNLRSVAQRYPQADVESELDGAISWAESNADPDQGAFPEADAELGKTCTAAIAALRAVGVTEKDENYLHGFETDLAAASDRMSRDGYNDAAEQFNRRVLGSFPASLMSGLGAVKEVLPVTGLDQ